MAREKPEARLTRKMRKRGGDKYGERLVIFKHHGSAYAQSGVSDLIGCLDGLFLACEVKAPESYGNSVSRALEQGPTAKQREFIRKVNASGGYGWFAATEEQFMEGLSVAEQMVSGNPRFVYTTTFAGETTRIDTVTGQSERVEDDDDPDDYTLDDVLEDLEEYDGE